MWKAILLTGALGAASLAAPARAADLKVPKLHAAACDPSATSAEARRGCAAVGAAKAQAPAVQCWKHFDSAQSGWSLGPLQFARTQASGVPMCQGQ